MAKKLKKKKKVVRTEKDNKIEYLNKLIELSMRAANGTSESLDELFHQQANRIREQLQKLKENP